MTAIENSFPSNFTSDKKPVDMVQKDVKKWVDSVVEFKANLEKKKGEPPLEKHLKKIKKFKLKKKTNSEGAPTAEPKNQNPVQPKTSKAKKSEKSDKSPADSNLSADKFDQIKETYRNIKVPTNWTSGVSGGRIVFNRVKLSTQNAQQKMTVERSLVITKDCNTHVLIGGNEILLNNWEMNKVETLEDVKKAIRDVEGLRICEGSGSGIKSPQCFLFVDSQHKTCPACKVDTRASHKTAKAHAGTKKTGSVKRKKAAPPVSTPAPAAAGATTTTTAVEKPQPK